MGWRLVEKSVKMPSARFATKHVLEGDPHSPMDWLRALFFDHVASNLGGLTLGQWTRLLKDNGFAISPRYWPRAALITGGSAIQSALAAAESNRFPVDGEAAADEPILFVLGHWRGGTTHLHNLLALDARLAAPNFIQCLFPMTFLLTERWMTRWSRPMLPKRRPADAMALGPGLPFEDEFALANLSGMSPYLGWTFPDRAEHYDRYLTFQNASEGERECWRKAFLFFVAKLRRRLGPDRILIFKSPPHTARVGLLAKIFPRARFVHIHRDPFAVYPSTVKLVRDATKSLRLRPMDPSDIEDRVIKRYAVMHRALFADVAELPKDRFAEISYRALEEAPLASLERIYDQLDLPPFAESRPAVEQYLTGLGVFLKNRFSPLEERLRQRLVSEWGFCFDAWGYPKGEGNES